MAFTEEAKKLIPSWLDETQVLQLHQQLSPTLSPSDFASLVKDPENWKRESKQKVDGNLERILDCRPLNSCLKLQVITDVNEQVIKHSFVVDTSGKGSVPVAIKNKAKKKVYLFVIGTNLEESSEDLSPSMSISAVKVIGRSIIAPKICFRRVNVKNLSQFLKN